MEELPEQQSVIDPQKQYEISMFDNEYEMQNDVLAAHDTLRQQIIQKQVLYTKVLNKYYENYFRKDLIWQIIEQSQSTDSQDKKKKPLAQDNNNLYTAYKSTFMFTYLEKIRKSLNNYNKQIRDEKSFFIYTVPKKDQSKWEKCTWRFIPIQKNNETVYKIVIAKSGDNQQLENYYLTVEPKYNKDVRFLFSYYVSVTKYDRNNLWRLIPKQQQQQEHQPNSEEEQVHQQQQKNNLFSIEMAQNFDIVDNYFLQAHNYYKPQQHDIDLLVKSSQTHINSMDVISKYQEKRIFDSRDHKRVYVSIDKIPQFNQCWQIKEV